MLESALRRLERKMGREFAVGCDMTLANAGTLLDPLVGSVHLLGEVGIGDQPGRQVGTAALNDRTYHAPPPPACSTGASAVGASSCNLARPSTSLLLYS